MICTILTTPLQRQTSDSIDQLGRFRVYGIKLLHSTVLIDSTGNNG